MPPRVKVTVVTHGADKLGRLGRAIKDSGDKDMRRKLLRAAQRCGKPMKAAAREGALKRLPRRGGLAADVAASKFGIRTRTIGKGAGVRIVGQQAYDLEGIEEGRIWHPVHEPEGTPRGLWAWVAQEIKPGWFSLSEEAAAPKFRDEFERAMDAVAAKLEASA